MKRVVACAALIVLGSLSAPALARSFVQDQAGMFSAGTVSALDTRIGNFNAQTGKEIVVMTVPSLGGATVQDAATKAFAQQQVNGVLIYIAKDDRRDIVIADRAGTQAGWFTPDVTRTIGRSMEAQFKNEQYDAGITAAVDGVLNVYRAHLGSLRHGSSTAVGAPMTSPAGANGGFHLSMFWWIVIGIVGFLLVRSILRSMSGPRYYPPGAGVAPGGPPPPGYGGPGYGGYGGYGGGGGSFFSGLLGGLGGAWLGNEIFGQHAGGGMIAPADAGQQAATGGDAGGGWQSDPGQADLGSASAGDWSGGGFGDGGGGGGDFGGGSGGDAGGGW